MYISTDTLVGLPKLTLKNNIFNFNENFETKKEAQQLRPSLLCAIASILFMAELEEKNLEEVDKAGLKNVCLPSTIHGFASRVGPSGFFYFY